MDKNEVERIYQRLKNSLFGFEVNGNPEKRRFYLLGVARYLASKRKKKK